MSSPSKEMPKQSRRLNILANLDDEIKRGVIGKRERDPKKDGFKVEEDLKVLEEHLEDEVVPKVENVSLVDGVFDGVLGGDRDDDFAIGEGLYLRIAVIMEYLVKISKKARILELKQRNMKIGVLTSYTSYPSRKIRRICACTSQKTTK
ncbi:hypothetical protein Tco_0520528 [Tanacetum coccineum]